MYNAAYFFPSTLDNWDKAEGMTSFLKKCVFIYHPQIRLYNKIYE